MAFSCGQVYQPAFAEKVDVPPVGQGEGAQQPAVDFQRRIFRAAAPDRHSGEGRPQHLDCLFDAGQEQIHLGQDVPK